MDFPLHKRLQELHKSSKCVIQNALKNDEVMLFSCVPAVCGEAERREPRCGDRGVRVGLHSAYSHPCQYAEQRACSPLWKTQCGGPDHVHQ